MAYKMTFFGSSAVTRVSPMVTSSWVSKSDVILTSLTNLDIGSHYYTEDYIGPNNSYLQKWTTEIEIPKVARVSGRVQIHPDFSILTSSLWLAREVQKTFLPNQSISNIGGLIVRFDPSNGVTKFEQTMADASPDSNSPNGFGILTLGIDLCSDLILKTNTSLHGDFAKIQLVGAVVTADGHGSVSAACRMTIEEVV